MQSGERSPGVQTPACRVQNETQGTRDRLAEREAGRGDVDRLTPFTLSSTKADAPPASVKIAWAVCCSPSRPNTALTACRRCSAIDNVTSVQHHSNWEQSHGICHTDASANTFYSATAESRRKDLIDNFFRSAPLIARLYKKNSIKVKGGTEIRVNHIYAGFPAQSYGRGTEFDTSSREFATTLVFDWKYLYAPVNLDVIDIELNDGPEAVFDLVDSAMENGELSLVDEMATQIFGDGSGSGGP